MGFPQLSAICSTLTNLTMCSRVVRAVADEGAVTMEFQRQLGLHKGEGMREGESRGFDDQVRAIRGQCEPEGTWFQCCEARATAAMRVLVQCLELGLEKKVVSKVSGSSSTRGCGSQAAPKPSCAVTVRWNP